jgi:predicted RNase H-like nuclease
VTDRVRVAGVDGWRGRWVVASVAPGGQVEWAVADSAAEVVQITRDCAAVAVDVPMGLPDGPGGRACDALARRRLPGAASSVFSAPVRAALGAATHPEAVAAARALGAGAPSIQVWHLTPGIRDWDDLLAADPARQDRIVECHPEVAFRALDPAADPWARKSTARGVARRMLALRPWVDPIAALRTVPAGPALDDALDALACAWSAHRWATGAASTLPADPPVDRRGLRMRIVV